MKQTFCSPINWSRRNMIMGGRGKADLPMRPPWTTENRIVLRCTRCNACLSACREGVLKQGQGGFPEFDPFKGSGVCTFCGDCASACPTDVFDKNIEPPWPQTATLNADDCLAFAGVHCSTCREACDQNAITMHLQIRRAPTPEINVTLCTGCGACIGPCPGRAMSLNITQTKGGTG